MVKIFLFITEYLMKVCIIRNLLVMFIRLREVYFYLGSFPCFVSFFLYFCNMIKSRIRHFNFLFLLLVIMLYMTDPVSYSIIWGIHTETTASQESASGSLLVDLDNHTDEYKDSRCTIIYTISSQPFSFFQSYSAYSAPDKMGVWQPPRNI